ncbi:MAG TPA: MFS transporter [Gaiellaceae bacterium]
MGLGGALSPLRERPFRLLWLGRVSSAVGDALVPVALAFAVLSVHNSYTALGGVLAAFTIARVAFTLVGGVVADRLPRRAVMLTCDLVRGAIEAFTAVMLLTHEMTLPLFFVTAAGFGAASAFFLPASDGLVPQAVSRANLQSANALLSTSRNALNVFGPVVSGTLIAAVGTGWVFAIDSASFAVSAFFLLQLRVDSYARAERQHFYRELREGWSEVISRSWVRAPIIGFAISNICFASFLVLGPVIFRNHLGGARDWGIVSACGAAGGILGSLASVRFRPHRPLTACFISSTLIALPIAALAGPLPMPAIAASWLVGFGAIVFANTYWETTLQRNIPEHVFSRVRSYDILVSFVFMPIGMIAFGPIAQAVGFTPTLLGAAAVAVVTNIAVAVVPGVHAVVAEPQPLEVRPSAA